MSYKFNVKEATEGCIAFIRNWFNEHGMHHKAVIGMSGGVDSAVTAALCVEALGKDRVIGIMMPQKGEEGLYDAIISCNHLGIEYKIINIYKATKSIYLEMLNNDLPVSEQTMINLPPRIRMSILYAVAQSVNGHVINTSNLSESYVGYDTLWGDSVGAISPLHDFTKSEILKIGSKLLIPEFLIDKAPADGLCGQTDEDRFGFTYKVLDKYLRTGVCEDAAIKEKIDTMHRNSQFKREMIQLPHFVYPTGSISPVIAKE